MEDKLTIDWLFFQVFWCIASLLSLGGSEERYWPVISKLNDYFSGTNGVSHLNLEEIKEVKYGEFTLHISLHWYIKSNHRTQMFCNNFFFDINVL